MADLTNRKSAALQPAIRTELEPLLAVLFTLIDEMRSVVVHVTAARHGEGTTTIAREIAAGAAASGWCKVALLDANPALPLEAAPTDRPGLVEQFERAQDPALRSARILGAPVMTGTLATPGRQLNRAESVRGLYGVLRSSFTLVVVDCPPVLAGQQAGVLSTVADGVILVAEAERTQATEVARARETLEQLGARIIGLILNKRRRRIPRFLSRFI